MSTETIIILVIVGLAIFVWLPAIVISGRKAMKADSPQPGTRRSSRKFENTK